NRATKTNFIHQRMVLSTIARIFDPLGLLAPIIAGQRYLCKDCGCWNWDGVMNFLLKKKRSGVNLSTLWKPSQ
ncbi:hypothetical protein TNCV_4267181, partial [Trichonephila clavipes]